MCVFLFGVSDSHQLTQMIVADLTPSEYLYALCVLIIILIYRDRADITDYFPILFEVTKIAVMSYIRIKRRQNKERKSCLLHEVLFKRFPDL